MKQSGSDMEGISWLARSREFRPPINKAHPLWLRHGIVHAGPVVSGPEFHPCCEFSILLEGQMTMKVGREKFDRLPGDILLLGPGLPHDQVIVHAPVRYATVFFDSFLLLELSPENA